VIGSPDWIILGWPCQVVWNGWGMLHK
jgi:hypothetical protein